MPDAALEGMKVLDPTQYVAGPYCTKMLADMGAEVIKIEKPGVGDRMRAMRSWDEEEGTSQDITGHFLYLNSNKKSITLNLKAPEGKALFTRLVATADAVVENYYPRVMPSLGLDYHTLERINPRLVMTSISNYGHTGPYRDYKGTHATIAALAGGTFVGGESGREPLTICTYSGLYQAGLWAAQGTLAAVLHAWNTGLGQHVDVSIQEAMMPEQCGVTELPSFREEMRVRGGRLLIPGYGTIMQCRDGYIGVNTLTGNHWEMLCLLIEMPEMLEEPRYQGAFARQDYAQEITDKVASYFADKSVREEVARANEMQIPLTHVQSLDELPYDSQNVARNAFCEVPHPTKGAVKVPAAPALFSESPWQMMSPPPAPGEHNEEVYGRLGLSGADLERLKERGVI